MKKAPYLFLLLMLVVPIVLHNVNPVDSLSFPDTPGDGFSSDDPCGFVYGVADVYDSITVDFDAISPNDQQGCVDANGFFYSDATSGQKSNFQFRDAASGGTYTVDLDYSAGIYVAQTLEADGLNYVWAGSGRIGGGAIPAPSSNRLVDFTWDCADVSCPTGLIPEDYYVRTDATTGEVSGYAWSDYFDAFLSFNGLSQELPPRQIEAYVDILANESDLDPNDVDYTTAPLADGAEFWRVRIQFWDSVQNRFLTPSEISNLTITPRQTSDSNMFMNQVTNEGDAIETSYANSIASIGCTDDSVYCSMLEDDGSYSFNKFIYSGAPSSNVLGLNDDSDADIEYYSDRDGCDGIYLYPEGDCPSGSGDSYEKNAVYFDRQNARNKWELESVIVLVEFNWTEETNMVTYGTEAGSEVAYVQVDDDTWRYYFEDGAANLSYRPRYQISKFAAYFDGAEQSSISEDTWEIMSLRTQALMSDTSSYFQERGGFAKPSYSVNYQMDASRVPDSAPTVSDLRLLIDTNVPIDPPLSGDTEETVRVDRLDYNSFSYTNYNKDYAIGYGQSAALCGLAAGCTSPTNTLTDPTAEQWVCDTATQSTMGEDSCYYTEYLPHIDRHDEPESLLVIGAINSAIDAGDLLQEISDDTGTEFSVLGATETVNMRNRLYSQVLRIILGQTPGSGGLDDEGAVTGDLIELMNGRVLVAEGDVTIDGFDGSDKTLVVIGGDVFLDANITNGRMGIISFKKDGEGGNVYILNTVTDLNANLFLDGSVFSYSGVAPEATVFPVWGTDELRLEALMDQLYLNGSIVSRNTVNGSLDSDGDGYYALGDGTETSSYEEAREYDLNRLRQFRQCFPLVGGILDTSSHEACDEGEDLSEYGTLNGILNSFILEYAPADQLPIFQSENSQLR